MTDASSSPSTPTIPLTSSAIIAGGASLSENHRALLEKRGITAQTAQRLGLNTCGKDGEWLEIPFFRDGKLVHFKRRTLGAKKAFLQASDGQKSLWNLAAIGEKKDMPLIITEGEMDAIIAVQCGLRAVAFADGAPSKQEKFDSKRYEALKDIPQDIDLDIVLAVDDDVAGHNLLHDLALRLGNARCRFVKYPEGCKDLNDVFLQHGEDMVCDIIRDAPHIRVSGVLKLSEFPPTPYFPPVPNGVNGISEKFKFRKRDFSVVTGFASMGKSTFINEIISNLADNSGWKIAIGSFEQEPNTDHKRNLYRIHAGKNPVYITKQESDAADAWIDKNFVFIAPPEFTGEEEETVDLQWLLQKMAAAVIRHGVSMIVIDPWNELEHAYDNRMTETQYVMHAIKLLKAFCRKYNVHVMVVNHPRIPSNGGVEVPNMYSISGSAHWANKADLGIVVHRNKKCTIIKVAKSRYHEIIGEPEEYCMEFNKGTGRYIYRPDLQEN